MTTEVALLISGASLAFSIYSGINNMKRNKKTDDQKEAGQNATIITKLDGIEKGVEDIKDELKNVKLEVREDHDRIIRLEESAKQAHLRINTIDMKNRNLETN